MQVEEESPKQYVDITRAPDKEMRPERLVPSGVAARTVVCIVARLDLSTYGLRRAPRIRSVLATTHHAPIIEIGSSQPTREDWHANRYRHQGSGSQGHSGRSVATARRHLHAVSQDPQLSLERDGADVPDPASHVRDAIQRARARRGPDCRTHTRSGLPGTWLVRRLREAFLDQGRKRRAHGDQDDCGPGSRAGSGGAHGPLRLPPGREGERRTYRGSPDPAHADP